MLGVVVAGPYNATGAGDTPSRREIFVCHPDSGAAEAPCAEQVLARLATRAYRRPIESGSDELDLLVGPERCDADQAMAMFRAILTRADLSP